MSSIRQISYEDGPNLDAFGRLRVSDTGQRLDVEFIYDKQEEFIDEVTTNGTATHNSATRDVTLALTAAANGDKSGLHSHPVPYTPGNSQLVDITGVFDLANIGGGNAEVFFRTSVSGSVVTTTYDQSTWDNLTTGMNWNYSHILSIDFQSLKVGRIRLAFVQNGCPVPIKEIWNDNVRNSGYWQLPSLPVFWDLYSDGTNTYAEMGYGDSSNAIGVRYKFATATAAATMKAICATVKSEGGRALIDMPGLNRSASNGVTPKTVSSTRIPLLSIRPLTTFKTVSNMGIALPESFSVNLDNPIRLDVIHDCSLTGASWTGVDANESIMEYDTSATALTNGHVLYSEYISTAKNTVAGAKGLLGKIVMWNRLGTETGIVTLAAVRTSGTDSSTLATLNWRELR